MSSLILTACGHNADYYGIPPQRVMHEAVRTRPESLLRFSDLNADDLIAGGVAPADSTNAWRWSYQKPEFRFRVDPNLHYRAILDFAIADVTFRDTGPVTIRFFVNTQLLAAKVYERSGSYRFDYAIPHEMAAARELTLSAEISPVWVAPSDGAKLGVILNQAGFIPE